MTRICGKYQRKELYQEKMEIYRRMVFVLVLICAWVGSKLPESREKPMREK